MPSRDFVNSLKSKASQEYARRSGKESTDVTAELGGIFAFWLLVEETVLDLTSTVLTRFVGVPWSAVFGVYTVVAIVATVGLYTCIDQPCAPDTDCHSLTATSFCHQMVAALDLLAKDSRTKYLVGFNIAFGWSGAFLNSFVSGEVVPVVLDSTFVGVFVALHGGVAALASLVFGRLSRELGKGPILVLGGVAFAGVAVPFLLRPDLDSWTWGLLVFVYAVQGIGRARRAATGR